MPVSRHTIFHLSSLLLGLLVLLLGEISARQEGAFLGSYTHGKQPAMSAVRHGLAFHKLSSKEGKQHHPVAPAKQHRRTRAHRPAVVKIAVPQVYQLTHMADEYMEIAPLPLMSVYRYQYFREITPPPPKGEC